MTVDDVFPCENGQDIYSKNNTYGGEI